MKYGKSIVRYIIKESPSMRREWIEIDYYMKMVDGKECLPPCGGSGLKLKNNENT